MIAPAVEEGALGASPALSGNKKNEYEKKKKEKKRKNRPASNPSLSETLARSR
jgi:hypothetical protein